MEHWNLIPNSLKLIEKSCCDCSVNKAWFFNNNLRWRKLSFFHLSKLNAARLTIILKVRNISVILLRLFQNEFFLSSSKRSEMNDLLTARLQKWHQAWSAFWKAAWLSNRFQYFKKNETAHTSAPTHHSALQQNHRARQAYHCFRETSWIC